MALHALQVLPLFGYVCGRYRPAAAGLLATWMFAAAYLGAAAWLFWQAMDGQPLVGHV